MGILFFLVYVSRFYGEGRWSDGDYVDYCFWKRDRARHNGCRRTKLAPQLEESSAATILSLEDRRCSCVTSR
ncbi:unnamed protein product [Linum trigynum]|uniref:Secreted protein n=1 Tax=Linum trigynum TaxID=586398 RepID=A0AAV2D994_9ROSI